MSIKLIAADLDGTLLNEKSEVSELTQRVLLRAQRDGIRLVLATGRDLPHFIAIREALHTERRMAWRKRSANCADMKIYCRNSLR